MMQEEAWGKFQVKLQDYGLAEWAHEEYTDRRREFVKDAARAYAQACVDAADTLGLLERVATTTKEEIAMYNGMGHIFLWVRAREATPRYLNGKREEITRADAEALLNAKATPEGAANA